MASISTDKEGKRIVQFVAGDGKRRSIRLGDVSMKSAEEVKRRVEYLVGAIETNTAPELDTVKWLVGISDDLHSKLAAVGLVESRASATMTIEKFAAEYVSGRADIKPRTRINLETCAARLVEHFGADRQMAKVKPGEADEFCAWLRARYAQATAARTIKRARQFFKAAVRKDIVRSNPFDGCKAGHMSNKARAFVVTKEAADKVLQACPDSQWRVLFALARFGGLRCPSETLNLEWSDVDWEKSRIRIRSPKKENDESAGERVIPLFPELRPYLEEAWDLAEEGTSHIVTRYRDDSANLRTTLNKIIRRAGLTPWERPWQNLRLSRQTELSATFPLHIVCAWMGNTTAVAAEHYLEVRDEDFERAAQSGAESGALKVQFPVQQGAARTRTESQDQQKTPENPGPLREPAIACGALRSEKVPPRGLDTINASHNPVNDLRQSPFSGAAESGAVGSESGSVDPELARLIEGWPFLTPSDRAAILAIVNKAL